MKYITYIRYIYIYIRNSIISLLSFLIINLIPRKNIKKLTEILRNKKVLVLGSGPSLDKLNQDIIDNYDVIFFLNNSISIAKVYNFNNKTKILFNSDLFRFKQLKNKIYSLDKTWIYIFVPVHLQLFFNFIFFYFTKKIYLIIPKFRIGHPFEKNVTKSIITYSLATNDDTKKILDFNNFKAFPHTVALNTFYFLISCKVSHLHYLGCDFNQGSSSLSSDNGPSNFLNKKIYLWVNKFKKLSDLYLIDFKDLK